MFLDQVEWYFLVHNICNNKLKNLNISKITMKVTEILDLLHLKQQPMALYYVDKTN